MDVNNSVPSLPVYHTPLAAPDEHGQPPKEPTKPGVTATSHHSRQMAKQLQKFAANMKLMKQGKIRPNREKHVKGSGVKGSHPVKSVAGIKYH